MGAILNAIFRAVKIFFGISLVIIALIGYIGGGKTNDTFNLVFFGILLIVGIFLIISGGKKKVSKKKEFINPYVNVLLYQNGGKFPKVNYSNVFLQPGEWIIYAVPAQSFIEKEQVVGYTGGSAGVSVRVAKGISVRSGSSKGRPVRQNIKKFNDGDYVVTNRRILFISQNDGFEFNLKKISATKMIAIDAFIIISGNKQKNICVDESQLKYAFSTTTFAINETNIYPEGIPQPPELMREKQQQLENPETGAVGMREVYTGQSASNDIRIIQESLDIMEKTFDIDTFLSRYDTAMRSALTLKQAKQAGIPIATSDDLTDSLVKVKKEQLGKVLERSFNKEKEEINKLKTPKGKLNRLEKYRAKLEEHYEDEFEFYAPDSYNKIIENLDLLKKEIEL